MATPQVEKQHSVRSIQTNLVVSTIEACRTRACNGYDRTIGHLQVDDIVDVDNLVVLMKASEDLRRLGSGKKSEIGGDVTHLSVDLAPAGDSGVTVGAGHGLHVGRAVSNLVTCATEQLADWVGHQHADHTHLAEMAAANQSPGFSCMAGVMAWAADEGLKLLSCPWHYTRHPADHTLLPEMAAANQSPVFSCRVGEMQWAAEENLTLISSPWHYPSHAAE